MSEPSIGQRAVAALQWSYAGTVLRALAQLVVQLLLARLLGPEAFGQATAALLVLSLGWILSEGGFGNALVQKATLHDHDVGYALGWVLLMSGTAGALVVLAAPWLAGALGDPGLTDLVRACGALIPLQAAGNIPVSLMRRALDMRRSQLIYLGAYLFSYGGIGLTLAWAGAGPWSIVAAFGMQGLVTLMGSYAVVRHTLRPRLRGDPTVARFGLQVTGTNIANWALENLDRLLVNRWWGSAALGSYTAAMTLSRAPANFLVGTLQPVTFAAASRMQDDLPKLARSFLALLALVLLVTAPLFTMLALHAEPIVHIAYGSRWQGAGGPFAAFCAALPFYAVLAVTGPLLWALQSVRTELAAQAAGLLVLLGGFLLLRDRPLATAAWVVPAMFSLRAGWSCAALARRLDVSARRLLRAAAGGAVLALLCAGIALACQALLPPVAALVASAPLALATCLLVLRRFPRRLVAPELDGLLAQRAADSAVLTRLHRLLGGAS